MEAENAKRMIGIFTDSLRVCVNVCVCEKERDITQWVAEHFHVYEQLLHTLDVFPICCALRLG